MAPPHRFGDGSPSGSRFAAATASIATLLTVTFGMLASAHAAAPRFSHWTIAADAHGRLAIGDVDGDGHRDVVVHGWNAPIVWYRYPHWTEHRIAPDAGLGGDEIRLADLDRDGDLDLIAPWRPASVVALARKLVGKQRKTTEIFWFENPGSTAVLDTEAWPPHRIGTHPKELKDLHVLDLDGDGKLDVVSRHHDVVALHFQEAGAHWTPRLLPVVEREGMAVGDLDADGDADLVLNGFWLEHPADARDGAWLRHDIDPLWFEMERVDEADLQALTATPAETSLGDAGGGSWRDNGVKVALADLDRDGTLDVVFSASERTEAGWPIAWYSAVDPKAGPGAWTRRIIGRQPNAHTLQIADFDGDGDADVLTCRLRDSDELPLDVYYNAGAARRWLKKRHHEGGCYSGKVADIDDDGDPDFVSSRTWQAPPVYLLRNQSAPMSGGRPSRFSRHDLGALPNRATTVIAADVDLDGRADLIAAGDWWRNPGKLDAAWTSSPIGEPLLNAFAAIDVDDDGDLDILGTQGRGASRNHDFAWAENDGTGVFTVRTNIDSGGSGDFVQGAVVADFGRGREVVVSWHNGGGGVHALRVPDDPRGQRWPFRRLSTVTQKEDLSVGDIDGDGDLDLLLGTIWLQNDDGDWPAFEIGDVANGEPDRNELFDLDRDGDLDAVVALENGTAVYWFAAPEDPRQRWERHLIGHVTGQGFSMDVGDFDDDGDGDVLVGEHRGDFVNQLIVFFNDSAGMTWQPWALDSSATSSIDHHNGARLADIDGDGDSDIVSIGWYVPKLWLYERVD